jgi:4-amino-4-deoxy-L-arabinose transferase-like glycosyltransferase
LLQWLFTILFSLIGLSLLIIALLPFGKFQMVLNLLSRDGTLTMLRSDNAYVFRYLLGMVILGIGGLAYLTAMKEWNKLLDLVKQLWRDFRTFLSFSNSLRSEWGFLVLMLIVMALAFIRRLALIERPISHDEAYTVVTFADTIFHAMTDYTLPNNHVFHTILVNLSIKTLGLEPWTARLPAFLAGVLIVPGVYFLAKRIYDQWTAILASVLVAFSPSLIDYSTTARGYILVTLFSLIILILGYYASKKRNLVTWGLISVFSALGLYTVPVMLFPFGILFVWLFLENMLVRSAAYSSKWEFLKYWLASGFFAALLTLLLYTPIQIYTGPQLLFENGFIAPMPWRDLLPTLLTRIIGTWAEWVKGIPLAILIVLGAGWVLSLIFHRKLSTIHTPLQVASFLWITILLIIQRPNALPKVWVFLLPLMLIWSAAGIVGLMRNVHIKPLYDLSLAGVVVGVVLLVGLVSSIELVPKIPALLAQRGDVESTVLFLKNNINQTDLIVVDSPEDSPVWFYALEHDINNIHFDKRIPFTRAWVLVSPRFDQTVESVVADRGPDIPALDLASKKLIQQIGSVQIFECPIK